MFRMIATTSRIPPLSADAADKLSENVVGVATVDFHWTSLCLENATLQMPVLGNPLELPLVQLLASSKVTGAATKSIVQAQIQLKATSDIFPFEAIERLLYEKRACWEDVAKRASGGMVYRGGGPCGFHLDLLTSPSGEPTTMAVVTLDVDVCDAMGANCLNAIAEAVSVQMSEDLPAEVTVGIRILTNACPLRRIQLTMDLPDSEQMQAYQKIWEQLSPSEQLYPFARGLVDMAKVTANDSRAVLAALAYDVHVTGLLPVALVQTQTGFQWRINAPAPFGAVGRLSRFPAAGEALSRMGIKSAGDIAFHAAVLGIIETISHVSRVATTSSGGAIARPVDLAGADAPLLGFEMLPNSPDMPSGNRAPMTAKLRDLDIAGRRKVLAGLLGPTDFSALDGCPSGPMSSLAFPVGVLPNLVINGRYLHFLAMTEEPSVVAGTCYGLKLLSQGLTASVQVLDTAFEVCLNVRIPVSALSRGAEYPGDYVRDAVVAACQFAAMCPERATTNNKGFDNGMSAAAMAMGWDDVQLSLNMHASALRSFDAMSTSSAARSDPKHYGPIVDWMVGDDGALVGQCRLSIASSVMREGHAFSCTALANRCVGGIEDQLTAVISAGMGVHLASLIALGTNGIQANHMVFHLR